MYEVPSGCTSWRDTGCLFVGSDHDEDDDVASCCEESPRGGVNRQDTECERLNVKFPCIGSECRIAGIGDVPTGRPNYWGRDMKSPRNRTTTATTTPDTNIMLARPILGSEDGGSEDERSEDSADVEGVGIGLCEL